jgi:hypothetical protein
MDATFGITGNEPGQVYLLSAHHLLAECVRLAAPEGFSVGFPRPASTAPGSLSSPTHVLVSITAFTLLLCHSAVEVSSRRSHAGRLYQISR